jgi:hypothetical protein
MQAKNNAPNNTANGGVICANRGMRLARFDKKSAVPYYLT